MVILDILTKRTNRDPADKKLPISGAYKSKWLFSMNEKETFRKLKEITDPMDCYLFTKVRLLDLVEPISGNKNYRTYMNKIQSKHVDFVICDKKLVARCIIELDDSSHKRQDRKERDTFVDEVLQSTGYQIIHVEGVTPELEAHIKTIFSPADPSGKTIA